MGIRTNVEFLNSALFRHRETSFNYRLVAEHLPQPSAFFLKYKSHTYCDTSCWVCCPWKSARNSPVKLFSPNTRLTHLNDLLEVALKQLQPTFCS